MRKGMRICALLLTLLMAFGAAAEAVDWMTPLRAFTRQPSEWTMQAGFDVLSPLGEERVRQLTELMKYVRLRLTLQPGDAGLSLRYRADVDGVEQADVSLRQEGDTQLLQTPLVPGTTYVTRGEAPLLNSLLGEKTADLPGVEALSPLWLLEDAYQLVNRLDALFADAASVKSTKTTIRSMGVARKVCTITLRAEEAEAATALLVSEAAGGLKTLLRDIRLTGQQQIKLWRDGENRPLKLTWRGGIAVGEESRTVDLSWSMIRGTIASRDQLTLKVYASGSKNNTEISLKQAAQKEKQNRLSLKTTYRVEQTADGASTANEFTADLRQQPGDDGIRLTGSAALMHKQKHQRVNWRIEPELLISGTNLQGQLRISSEENKLQTMRLLLTLKAEPGDPVVWQDETTVDWDALTDAQRAQHSQALREALQRRIVPALVLLPEEATKYLSDNLSEEAWNRIVQAAKVAATEEGNP